MARPIKEGLKYFSHDTDAVNDEKIETLRALYGNDGYAFFFIILERIYRTSKSKLDVSPPNALKVLAKRVGVRIDKFNKMLETALAIGCFDKELYDKSKELSSSGIMKRASFVLEKREKMRNSYAQSKLDADRVSSPISDAETPPETTPETPQSKLKETKQKETILPEFITVENWDAYMEMRKKKRATPTEHGKVLLIKKLEEFRAAGDDPNEVLKRSIMNGWTGIFPLDRKGGQGGAHQQGSRSLPKHYRSPEELFGK